MTVRRPSKEEAKKLQGQLSVMKSQGWLSQEGSVLQLLCADPCCHISNDMALDIQRLLTGKNTLITPTSAGISPRSACLEILFMSGVSKQNLQLGSKNSRELLLASVTSTLLQSAAQKSLTQMAALSTVVVSIQDYWDEHLQLGKGFQLPDVPRDSGTRSSSRLDETEVSVNKQEMIYSNHSLFHENQSLQPLRSQVSLLFLSTEVTNLTHAMALHMVTIFPAHLPFLSPEVLRLLEVHVKKWMRFQRWGLPRCVEESLRQLMPDSPFFYWPGNSQPVPFIMYDTFNACVVTIETISHKTWGSCVLYQTTQAFWVTKWSIMDQEQSCHCQKTPNSLALALPSPALKVLNGLYPQPGGQAEDSGNHLKQKHSQLFCSFSCLTTESLAVTYIHFQGLSTNRRTPQLPSNVPFLFKGPSFLHLLPNNPPRSTPLSSLPTPNWVSPPDHQQIQINLPFLTPAEYEALEWNLLERQLQLRWEFPAIFQRSQHAQSPMQYEPSNTPHSPETQLLLSPADQQPLPARSKASDNVNVPQPPAPEADGGKPLQDRTLQNDIPQGPKHLRVPGGPPAPFMPSPPPLTGTIRMRGAGPGLALHRGPRTALGRSAGGHAGSWRRGRSNRLKRRLRARAQSTPSPPAPSRERLRRVRPRQTPSAGRWAGHCGTGTAAAPAARDKVNVGPEEVARERALRRAAATHNCPRQGEGGVSSSSKTVPY
ncbi:protein FAM205A-like [Trichechus manatus latirostris]|uniref:Protein FAM205A-like n=1 Tax=Trichechus manatus latirostris TaxID=127582 RepID=A0A2Y9FXK7_TRIMA|nr:protein FAM205A-like [Trichechus manatus latirostris]